MKNLPLITLLLIPCFFAPACNTPPSGGVTDLSSRVPQNHRPAATACSMTRAPGPSTITAGQCKQDSDCVDTTKGQNGRCVFSRIGPICSYDECFDDSTCLSKVCLCRPGGETVATQQANHCLLEGNCLTDGDCGAGGACSPSFSTCGSYSGVVAYYCHTPQDTCLDDADCLGADGGFGGPGYCMFSPEGGKWICAYSQCAG